MKRLAILRKQRALLLFVCISLSACRVTLVPDYSADLEEQIVSGAKQNDMIYLYMLAKKVSDREYSNFIDRYNEVSAEINSIEFKNQARTKNTEMLKIIKNLKDHFEGYRLEHQQNSTLSDGEIKAFQAQIRAFWVPLLVAEKGLKLAK